MAVYLLYDIYYLNYKTRFLFFIVIYVQIESLLRDSLAVDLNIYVYVQRDHMIVIITMQLFILIDSFVF